MAAVMVVLLVMGLVFLGFVLLIGGAVGETEIAAAADEEFCDGVSPPVVGGQAVHPMTGAYTVNSEFGVRVHPITGERVLHAGIDLAHTQAGRTVAAVLDGVVTQAQLTPSGGNVVAIDHGGGLGSRYLHLDRLDVEAGQEVTAGEAVGIEGNTGRSTGRHLHFEVLREGKPIDPRGWLTSQGFVVPAVGSGVAPVPAPPTPPMAGSGSAEPARSTTAAVVPASVQVPGYDAEQLRNAGYIVAAGQELDLGQWEITVAVMTAMGESSLYNIDYGDEAGPDSRGLFQQRDSWGTLQERMHPPTAARFFFEALVQVPGYRDLAPTIAANRVQRNADPFHYVPYWPDAGRIVAAITGDDDFLRDLPPAGDLPVDGCVPPGGTSPGPIGECPATGSPAEAGLTEPTLYMMRCGFEAYPVPVMYGVGDRPSLPTSDHPHGRAVDFALADYRTPEGNAYGWEMSHWLVEHAAELEIKYVIFDMKVWRPDSGWGPYTQYGPNPPNDSLAHRDHVHVSVNG